MLLVGLSGMVISNKPLRSNGRITWFLNLVRSGPVNVCHEIGKGPLLAALLQDFNLAPTWCRPGAGRGIQLVVLNRVGNFNGGWMH